MLSLTTGCHTNSQVRYLTLVHERLNSKSHEFDYYILLSVLSLLYIFITWVPVSLFQHKQAFYALLTTAAIQVPKNGN
jgi:hypothetical protein